jgi:hypothetical protein
MLVPARSKTYLTRICGFEIYLSFIKTTVFPGLNGPYLKIPLR